jgi:type II secretory pathway pseudopilin PulG
MTNSKQKSVKVVSGVSLIELLIVIAMLGLIGAGFLGLQYVFSQNQVIAWQNYMNVEEANSTITQITRELRTADQSEDGSYLLETPNDQEIVFFSDVDYDGIVEKVKYSLDGTNLTKTITEPTTDPITYPAANERAKVITGNIRNGSDPIFYYFNSDWPSDTTNNPLTVDNRISDTRLIKTVIKLNTRDDADTDYTLESMAKLRMLNGN